MTATASIAGDFLGRLEGVRSTGEKKWQARCPGHDDGRASLSITEKSDGTLLINCHANCNINDVLSALGMKLADLFPKSPSTNGKPRRQKRIVETYNYRDADGKASFQSVRFDPKGFAQRKPDGKGGWIWKVDGCPIVPFRLWELSKANASHVVFVCEGEKDCNRLASLGLIATTNAGGAGKWKSEHAKYLAGRRVVILRDNDDPGRKHGEQVAQSLDGIAAGIKVIDLPGLPAKGDVSDWLDAGGTREQLLELVSKAPKWTANQSSDPTSTPTQTESPISNYSTVEVDDDNGGTKRTNIPRSMSDIIADIRQRFDDWPRRIDNVLFVDDPEHGIDWFDRRTTAGLFGWLRRHCPVEWAKGGNFVGQAEVFAEIERTAPRYEAIELLPHEPAIEGVYYRGQAPPIGDGSHLAKLLDQFRPETTIDRDLIQAALMTAFWGGLPGCRPAFVITSDDGRGVGKSKVPEVVGYLCGGCIDVSALEKIETLKTRMLSPVARTKRIVVLDNVKSLRLSWAELEAMITSPIISGKQLFVGEGQRPNLLTWFLTLNGVSMATDMAQRSVIIKVVKGKNDGPWWEQLRHFIDQHRQEIIGDILAALRGPTFPLAAFSRWATWEQHILCRLPEPGDAQRLILERQGEANCELDEAEIIEEHFANQLRRLDYDPQTAQVRIPVAVAARWYGWAVNEPTKTTAASKRLHQIASEGQAKRIAPDSTRTYGRCFIWTGARADVVGQSIANDLPERIARMMDSRDA